MRTNLLITTWRAGFAAAIFLLVFEPHNAPAQQADSSSNTAMAVSRVSEVIDRWKPDQHLYVKGDVGVSQSQLNALEVWLDQNATNWTVILIESAQGERHVDATGRRYENLDAVEYALGQGLPNRTEFGQMIEPRTKERNGAFFALSLKDRELFYFGSDAQDRRGLGENNWKGNLDRAAINAMRSGGRVVDAVKDTVSNINQRLDQRIRAEITDRERRAAAALAQRAQAAERAKAAIKSAEDAVSLLEQKTSELNEENPQLSGDIARPDLPQLRAELAAANTELVGENFSAASDGAERVRNKAQSLVRQIEDYRSAPATFERLNAELQNQQRRPHAESAAALLKSAGEALRAARHEHQIGSRAYENHLARAETALRGAAVTIGNAAKAAAIARQLSLALLVTTLAALGGLGFGLNRRRSGAKRDALDLLGLWESGLSEKNTALFQLLDRVSTVVGASVEDASRRYAGETLRVSGEIVKDVDELFIMSACTGRILGDAKRLVLPYGRLQRVWNLFAAGRYRAAVRMLRDQPITFRPDEALELVVRGPKTERDTLLGHLEDYKPFTMSFHQLIEAFNTKAARALAGLDLVQSSVIRARPALEAVQQTIDNVRRQENERANLELFTAPKLFSELIPAAQAAAASALQMSIKDPVGALQSVGADAERMAADAAALAEILAKATGEVIPRCEEAAAVLSSAGVQTIWIGEALRDASDDADALAFEAVTESIDERMNEFRNRLDRLTERVETAVSLDCMRREQTQPDIVSTIDAIDQARRDLALTRPPEKVLREEGTDPSDRVGLAEQELIGAKAALDRGDVDAARRCLDEVGRLMEEARAIIDATRKAFAEHPASAEARARETERIEALIPEREATLRSIRESYASSVLLLANGDPAHPNANRTVDDNIDEAKGHVSACRDMHDRSKAAFASARYLEATDLLERIAARQEEACHRLEEIREKEARLIASTADNAKALDGLTGRLADAAPEERDRRTTRPTLDAFGDVRRRLEMMRNEMARPLNDPFQIATELEAIRDLFESVLERARCDRELYTEAERSIEAARSQLNSARKYSDHASTDRVTDSAEIERCRAAVQKLEQDFARAAALLRQAHYDWSEVDAQADSICVEASRIGAALRHELEKAEAAADAVSAAASAIRSASCWTGAYRVRIGDALGADLLAGSRARLEAGDYTQATSLAMAARRTAEQAIALAEAEVHRREREALERIERERRRRAAAAAVLQRRSSSMSSSGGGRRSGFSMGSGVSRGSFRSGSGVGRSGW